MQVVLKLFVFRDMVPLIVTEFIKRLSEPTASI